MYHSTVLFFMLVWAYGPALAQESKTVTLKKGTPLTVRLTEWVHTGRKGVRKGDMIPFILVTPIEIEGRIVLKEGAEARGTVTQAKGAKSFGRKGKLSFTVDHVIAVDNQKIMLRADPAKAIGERGSVQVETLDMETNGFTATANPASAFARGNEAFLDKGSEYRVYVSKDAVIRVD